jgi:hypothetical protein
MLHKKEDAGIEKKNQNIKNKFQNILALFSFSSNNIIKDLYTIRHNKPKKSIPKRPYLKIKANGSK